MLSPAQLFGLLTESLFVLLGALLLWVGLTGRYFFDPRRPTWLALGAFLIYWGVRAIWKTSRTAQRNARIAAAVRGGSLIVTGLIMTSIAWAPFRWVGMMLAAAGGILVLRGMINATLSARAT